MILHLDCAQIQRIILVADHDARKSFGLFRSASQPVSVSMSRKQIHIFIIIIIITMAFIFSFLSLLELLNITHHVNGKWIQSNILKFTCTDAIRPMIPMATFWQEFPTGTWIDSENNCSSLATCIFTLVPRVGHTCTTTKRSPPKKKQKTPDFWMPCTKLQDLNMANRLVEHSRVCVDPHQYIHFERLAHLSMKHFDYSWIYF